MNDAAIVAIADQCPNLKRLDLTQDADQTFRTLAVVPSLPSLTHLGGAPHQFTSEGVTILTQHPNVTSLEVHGQISAATLRNIAPLGGQLKNLVADLTVASESPLAPDAYRQLAAFEKLEEFTFQGIQSSPSDSDLQAIAAFPQLQRVSLRFEAAVQADVAGSGRRYSDEGLAAFRKARPDVELSADGVAYPATAAFGSVEIPALPEVPVAVPEPTIIDEPITLAAPEIRLAGIDQPMPAGYQPTLKMGDPLGAFATVASPSRINGLLSWSVEPIRHRGGATCIDASRDGLIASGGADSTVRLWTADGQLIRVLTGHINAIASVAFSPDGKLLASVSVSPYSQLAIWDVASGRRLQALPTSNSQGRLEWSPDGTRLAHAASDYLEVFEAANWTRRRVGERLKHPSDVGWSPDGQKLFLVCSEEYLGFLYEANTLKQIGKPNLGRRITSLSWSPDGQVVVITGPDGGLVKPAQSLEGTISVLPDTTMHDVEFSPDGTMLAMGGDGMKLFSTTDWSEAAIARSRSGNDVCWSPAGDRILSLDQWYEPATKTRIVSPMQSGTNPVRLAVSPDGLRIASRTPSRLRIWDGNSGELILEKATEPAAETNVSQMGWQPGGKLIFQVNQPNRPASDKLALIDSESGEVSQTFKGHTGTIWSAAWSPDGKRLASVSEDGTCLLWNLRSGEPIKTLKHAGPLWWVVWSADGAWLATGSAANEITVWDAVQGRPLQTFKTLSQPLIEPSSKQYSDDAPFAFTRDASQICVVGVDNSFDRLNVGSGTTTTLGQVKLADRVGGPPQGIHWTNNYTSMGVVTSDRELNFYTFGAPQGSAVFRFLAPHWLDDGRRIVGLDSDHTSVVGIDLRRNRRLGTLLPELGDDAWAAISVDGHVRGSRGLGNHLAIVAVLSNGRTVTMTPQEFATRFPWKNESAKVRLLR